MVNGLYIALLIVPKDLKALYTFTHWKSVTGLCAYNNCCKEKGCVYYNISKLE